MNNFSCEFFEKEGNNIKNKILCYKLNLKLVKGLISWYWYKLIVKLNNIFGDKGRIKLESN